MLEFADGERDDQVATGLADDECAHEPLANEAVSARDEARVLGLGRDEFEQQDANARRRLPNELALKRYRSRNPRPFNGKSGATHPIC